MPREIIEQHLPEAVNRVTGANVFDLLALIEDHGFTGVGLRQKGVHDRSFVQRDNPIKAIKGQNPLETP